MRAPATTAPEGSFTVPEIVSARRSSRQCRVRSRQELFFQQISFDRRFARIDPFFCSCTEFSCIETIQTRTEPVLLVSDRFASAEVSVGSAPAWTFLLVGMH